MKPTTITPWDEEWGSGVGGRGTDGAGVGGRVRNRTVGAMCVAMDTVVELRRWFYMLLGVAQSTQFLV